MHDRPSFRSLLKSRTPVIGAWTMLPSPDVVELLALAGMDYVIIDMQHASPTWDILANMIRAADVRGIAPIVRVNEIDARLILKVLELGVDAIYLPFVRTPDDIRTAVDAMRFFPEGHRSTCHLTRSAGYSAWARGGYADHIQRLNERAVLIAIAEEMPVIENIGDLAAVRPGADVIGIGRGDISTALGFAGQYDHPDVVAVAERGIAEVRTRSGDECASSIQVRDAADIPRWLAKGCRMFTFASDTWMLMGAAQAAVNAFRVATGSRNGIAVAPQEGD